METLLVLSLFTILLLSIANIIGFYHLAKSRDLHEKRISKLEKPITKVARVQMLERIGRDW